VESDLAGEAVVVRSPAVADDLRALGERGALLPVAGPAGDLAHRGRDVLARRRSRLQGGERDEDHRVIGLGRIGHVVDGRVALRRPDLVELVQEVVRELGSRARPLRALQLDRQAVLGVVGQVPVDHVELAGVDARVAQERRDRLELLVGDHGDGIGLGRGDGLDLGVELPVALVVRGLRDDRAAGARERVLDRLVQPGPIRVVLIDDAEGLVAVLRDLVAQDLALEQVARRGAEVHRVDPGEVRRGVGGRDREDAAADVAVEDELAHARRGGAHDGRDTLALQLGDRGLVRLVVEIALVGAAETDRDPGLRVIHLGDGQLHAGLHRRAQERERSGGREKRAQFQGQVGRGLASSRRLGRRRPGVSAAAGDHQCGCADERDPGERLGHSRSLECVHDAPLRG
ncbi:hypothetical protein ABE10_05875, partial [Bacillus toyonensis]|nr:hypothetical protein [Bacillus toyonensis]